MMNDTVTMQNEVAVIQLGATWRGFRAGTLLAPGELPRITAPTLWLWGTRDPFGSVEIGRAWAGVKPSSAFEVLEEAGHLPWLDGPEWHAARIAAFLGEE